MPGITITVPTDNANARVQLAAQLTIAAASLMPRVEDSKQAIDRAFDLYARISEMIDSAAPVVAGAKADNP